MTSFWPETPAAEGFVDLDEMYPSGLTYTVTQGETQSFLSRDQFAAHIITELRKTVLRKERQNDLLSAAAIGMLVVIILLVTGLILLL